MKSDKINRRYAARLSHSFTAFKKKKIFTFVASSDEVVRLSEIIKRFDKVFAHKYFFLDCDGDRNFINLLANDLGIREPNRWISCVGKSIADEAAKVLFKSYQLLAREKPEAVLALGDSDVIYSLVAAKELGIPAFHFGAGKRLNSSSFHLMNELIADHISDKDLVYDQKSFNSLIKEGVDKNKLSIVGSPMNEVLWNHRNPIECCNILAQLGLKKDNYIVISINQPETVFNSEKLSQISSALYQVADYYHLPVILLTQSWTQHQIEENKITLSPLVKAVDLPLGFLRLCKLKQDAFVTLSDSLNLIEESSILQYPCVLLKPNPKNEFFLKLNSFSIVSSIKEARLNYEGSKPMTPFAQGNIKVGEKVQKIIDRFCN